MSAPCITKFLKNHEDVKHYIVLSNNEIHVWVEESKYLIYRLTEEKSPLEQAIKNLPTHIGNIHWHWETDYQPLSNNDKRKATKQLKRRKSDLI